jgi:phenylalanyl-tRNA synthetase alpha chain
MAKYKLTPEGESYLKHGLPEKNLVKVVSNAPGKFMMMAEAAKKVDNFPIALKWALENGWVSKSGGNIMLNKIPEKTDLEEALEGVSRGKEVAEDILKVLEGRNLVTRITQTYEKTEERIRAAGNVIGDLTHDMMRTGLWKGRKFQPAEVEILRKKLSQSNIPKGNRQPYNNFLLKVKQKLIELGFKEVRGSTIVTEFWNFDALFQAQNHPSRDWTQTYSLKYPKYGKLPDKKLVDKVKATHENGWTTGSTGWGYKWDPKKASQLMPVAHDTAFSPITLSSKELKIPGKYFQIVRCYRPDVIDNWHGVEFNQMGGFVVGKDLNFKNLLGLLKQFVYELIGPYKTKFTTGYFPFTEPSCEISVKHPEMGWIESAGAGIFREELTKPLGVEEPVMAWGFGVDRLAMFSLKLSDIRELFSQNLEWLRKSGDLKMKGA